MAQLSAKERREFINRFLTDYIDSELMQADWMKLDSKDRLALFEKLLTYTMPRIQSIQMDMNASICKKTIEDTLKFMSKKPK